MKTFEFGKAYRTEKGEKALYIGFDTEKYRFDFVLMRDGVRVFFHTNLDGSPCTEADESIDCLWQSA